MFDERTVARFWSKVEKRHWKQCWEWKRAKTHFGYGRFCFRGKDIYAHRFSFLLKEGSIPEGLHILHTCHNPSCVNPHHLKTGTNSENVTDRVNFGRHYRGEQKTLAKLNNSKVRKIRKLYATGNYSQRVLSKMFEVSQPIVCDIINRKRWTHVD